MGITETRSRAAAAQAVAQAASSSSSFPSSSPSPSRGTNFQSAVMGDAAASQSNYSHSRLVGAELDSSHPASTLRLRSGVIEPRKKKNLKRRRPGAALQQRLQFLLICFVITFSFTVMLLLARWKFGSYRGVLLPERRIQYHEPVQVMSSHQVFERVKKARENTVSSFRMQMHHNVDYLHQRVPLSEAGDEEHPEIQNRKVEQAFSSVRGKQDAISVLRSWSEQLNQDIFNNIDGGVRFVRSYLLPSIPGRLSNGDRSPLLNTPKMRKKQHTQEFMRVKRAYEAPMIWEDEWKQLLRDHKDQGPIVDYTDPRKYTYPALIPEPPPSDQYPIMIPLGKLMEKWNHDEDFDGVFEETLMHFNYSNDLELEMARKYRKKHLPFKLYGVPELIHAGAKWTDDYLSVRFSEFADRIPKSSGLAQESPNNYFAFFIPKNWNSIELGLPPVTDNDWSYRKWSEHARYADSIRLSPHQPHFYWQSGVPAEERHRPPNEWTFISRDLPSLSSSSETFFVWKPEEQKGIQCRFGERGVVAATHYDSGRNSVAMITGAKRYILSPPRACSKLGIFPSTKSPIYRHSLLNFAHIPLAQNDTNDMSKEERAWLNRAAHAEAIDTVVKAGEVLFIPSFYFHYIISLQKSAQCNVRSGIDHEPHPVFGGEKTVEECVDV